MRVDGLIITACWVVFILVWWLAAFFVKRTVERQSMFTRLMTVVATAAAVVLMFAARLPLGLRLPILPHTPAAGAAGAAICVLGFAFTFWARFTIGRNWSGTVTFKQDHELIQSGPYRLVRHPIYTGVLTMMLGSVLFVGTRAALLAFVMLCVGFKVKSRQEEEMMMKHFPDAYARYKARVRALLPIPR